MDFARPNVIYAFGEYRIDTALFQVTRGDSPLSVEPQVLELLIVLIENRDHVVTRDELIENVWKGRVVSDTTLSSRIKTARQLIGDDGTRQQFIKTVHGRGFRFVGQVEVEAGAQSSAGERLDEPVPIPRPATRYAKSGDVHIAYHLFGNGSANIILMPGFVSHIDNYWDQPGLNRYLCQLGSRARMAMFDKRGTGMSDKVDALPGMDERMDDVRAVMDAAGFETAFVMGVSEGGPLAALFAAHHPERCDGLIMYGAFARFKHWVPDDAALQQLFDYIESDWGSGKSLPQFAPGVADDPEFVRWWGKFERLGGTPGATIALMKMNSQIDISHVLPTIQVPTLVIHRSNDVLIDIEAGRQLAAEIPGAQYVELPGYDHLPFVGNNRDDITDAILRFLEHPAKREKSSRVLATIVLVDYEGDPATLVSDADASAVKDRIRRYRASRIAAKRNGVVATFDGPARGIECAQAVSEYLRGRGIDHRIGVHAGEIDLASDGIGGVAMDIARDVAGHAGNNEIRVSRTVNDLVAGSGFELADCGVFSLPSIQQDWHLFRLAG